MDMKYWVLWLGLCLWSGTAGGQSGAAIFPDLEGDVLAQAVRQAYRPASVLSYRDARDTLYAIIDWQADSVRCFYTDYPHYLEPGTDPSQDLFDDGKAGGINCEHSWPRSKGSKNGQAFSDMHHLFPTRVDVNQARGNLPFGEVHDHRTRRWFYLDQELESLPSEGSIDLYSELGDGRFEPREAVKGDIARALFYIYFIYPDIADELFFTSQISTLRYWHEIDPPDERELRRTWLIASYQDDKPNPFIVDPELITRILGKLD